MNSTLIGKLKPFLVYLVPVVLISPSLIWIALDQSVWTWDPALYGKGSVELFFILIFAPTDWISQMLDVVPGAAPGMSWFGQFFVPLGYLLGSIDVGLLLSIWVTQAVTLILMYRSVRELSGQNQLVSITGCLVIASAPLFVGMSHQYFTEPLQLLAGAWFLTIMSFAPKWSRAFILSQLLVATPVAMLAKVSSPLYCLGPGLVALWYVFKPGPSSFFVKHEWLQKRVVVALAAGVLLSLAAIAWYYRNIPHVIDHVSKASSGPIAELYGKKDSFLNAMLYRLGAIQNSFFLPSVLLTSGSIFGFGVLRYFVSSKTETKHFTICSATAILQILIVLATFSLNSNRETRFLLPLLPHFTLLICWSVAQINKPLLTTAVILIFLAQLAVVHGQALGILSRNPQISGWLLPAKRDGNVALTLDSLVSRTCTETRPERYWNIVGDQKSWLNVNTLGYTAAKKLAPENRIRCYYGYLGYVVSDLDKTWKYVLSLNPRYYITSDPEMYPISADKTDQAVNQLNAPVLKKVQTSGLFEPEPPLPEDPGILIFRQRDRAINLIRFVAGAAEASAVAEHGVQSVRGARFGASFELLGAQLTPAAEGMELKLAWRCVREARLDYLVAVHFVDETGKILAQSDYAQDVSQARVTPGALWVDRVSVPAEKLKRARRVGIALYALGRRMELVDRGPRDWDGHRLLLPLEQAGTTESATR
jgi:hypothetical protein